MIKGWETCVDCGAEFYKKGPRQIRCRRCQKKHEQKLAEKRKKKKTDIDKKRAEILSGKTECHKGNCIYSMRFSGYTNMCGYILITGKSRPCPVQGCTEYKTEGRKKKNRIVINSEEYAERIAKGKFAPYEEWEERKDDGRSKKSVECHDRFGKRNKDGD